MTSEGTWTVLRGAPPSVAPVSVIWNKYAGRPVVRQLLPIYLHDLYASHLSSKPSLPLQVSQVSLEVRPTELRLRTAEGALAEEGRGMMELVPAALHVT